MNANRKSLLLVNLPGATHRAPEEHCGLAFLKAYLCQQGIDAEILDAYAAGGDDAYCCARFDAWLRAHADSELYIGISPYVTGHAHLVSFGEYVRRAAPGGVIFAGGHYATLNREELMATLPWLDAIVVGEGELSVVDLISQGNGVGVPGVYSRGHEESFVARERITDLDALPFQDRYLTPKELGRQPMSITTSRGCYGECSFCSIASFYKCNSPAVRQTFRTARSVSEEIHDLVRRFGITALKIVDDNFFRGHDDVFLEELVDRVGDLGLTFRLSARPNDITVRRAHLLRQLGVSVVAIGVESANGESLKLYRKGVDVDDSEKAIAALRAVGITCLANFIMFDPIVGLDGLMRNCDFVEQHLGDCVFHRINSHLWLRRTDPVVVQLMDLGLCGGEGYPYLRYRFRDSRVGQVKAAFDDFCESDMTRYYRHADVVMANGAAGNHDDFAIVRNMAQEDVSVLRDLIRTVADGGSCK